MQTFEERLGHFGQAAAEAIDSLMGLMTATPAATAAPARAMLGAYCDLVQQIGQAAESSGLGGLQSICALVETNLLLIQDDKRALSPDEAAVLESWPMLLFSYLANRADRESSAALLHNL